MELAKKILRELDLQQIHADHNPLPGIVDLGREDMAKSRIMEMEEEMAQQPEQNTPIEDFWMVIAIGGNAPAFKHKTLESAMEEAERICAKTGYTCYVAKVVARCARDTITWRSTLASVELRTE